VGTLGTGSSGGGGTIGGTFIGQGLYGSINP
jgi:hypothetical protein